jgi:subtilase family serine protease
MTALAATALGASGAAASTDHQPPAHVIKPHFGPVAVEVGKQTDPIQRANALTMLASDLPDETKAYGVEKLWNAGVSGAGTTIAVIDSFGDPNIRNVIDAYDKAHGLPAADVETITPAGPLPPCTKENAPATGCQSWIGETDLDVTMAHALAPAAKILVVATPVNETQGFTGLPEMMFSIDYLAKHHLADVISMSLGATEETFPSFESIKTLDYGLDSAVKAGIPVLASSGDDGASGAGMDGQPYPYRVAGWPASDSRVTAIGGTVLSLDKNGKRTKADVLWPLSGGGMSKVYKRPSWQDSVANITGSGMRAFPDICMEGIHGTSQAAPLFAAVIALATQEAHGHPLGELGPSLYQMGPRGAKEGIVDVTEGDNAFRDVPGFTATKGYDVVSGWGTVDPPTFVPALVRLLHGKQGQRH